ncbi:MAG: cellulose biosynthesis cyclic di-GMP-binding regulatory protein BcsB [Anaerolineales bacterium]|nr:cellulose biosynthesis cyclic di-GMP-binding regulatory protein BcsB [Anaerolineales bacterium]MBX3038691.1 cellulose biosynthesis cyclic di-GMP-binding regulatory protein BcsB [Anaerolineales bacterium]
MKIKSIILALLIALLGSPVNVFAQQQHYFDSTEILPDIQITENRATFTFADLGISERTLLSPFSQTAILFSTPADWQITAGSTIQFQFDVLISGAGLSVDDDTSYLAGVNLVFRFNNVVLGVVSVDKSGSYTQTFPIPSEAFVPTRADGRHIISVALDAELSCNYELSASVSLKLNSVVDLFYQKTNPNLNLSKLPAPFYLDNSLVKDSTLIIINDNPSPVEIQSAMNVIAGLGAMIEDEYNFQLLNYSKLDETLRSQNNLIFVGFQKDFAVLSEVEFQSLTDTTNNIIEDDGILHLALSPWNQSKSILLVSGNSFEGLSKAAHAFSTGNVLVYQEPYVAYVSNVQFLPTEIPAVEEFKIEDLGYASLTLEGSGSSTEEIVFYASKSQIATTDAYFEIVYNHSGLTQYTSSAFSLYLNGNVFFTKVLSKETEQVTKLQVRIPPGFLRQGENILEIEANMIAFPTCENANILRPWFTVSNQSSFFMPVAQSGASQIFLRDLKFYPEMFTISSDLGEVAFILPAGDLEAWQIAAQIAYELGANVQPDIANLQVAFGDAVPDEIKENRSLIIIGKPNALPIVSDINDLLPAPFNFEDNTASERQLLISYRIPQGQSIGYLELLQSPFNSEKTILIVSGNTNEGVLLAGRTLILSNLQDQLAGVFAVTNGTQIATGSSNASYSIIGEGVPGSQQVSEIQITPQQAAPLDIETPSWLNYFLVATSVVILIVIIDVFRRFLLKDNLRRKQEKLLEQAIAESSVNEDDEEK